MPPDRRQPESARRLRFKSVIPAGVLVITLLIWAALALRGPARTKAADAAFRTVRVERRDFLRTLRLTGATEAVRARTVMAPELAGSQVGSLIITKLAPAGARVKRADLLVEFDRQNQIKNFLDKQAEYRDLIDQIARKTADQDAALAKDETELKQAEDEVKRTELEILKNAVISRIDAEKNQEALEEAKASLKQLRETFDLKRRAAQAAIRVLEIQRDRARETMLHAQRNQERMTVRSPIDGVVVLNAIPRTDRMGQVQEGDEVRPGVPFMQVVNPSAMQVRVPVNQVDLLSLRPGQRAEVRLDAYPEMVFRAQLEQLSPLGNRGRFSETVRTFAALFSIEGSDPKLMPDLSAAVDVELERRASMLVVPYECVLREDGKTYVRLESSLGFEMRPVKLGPMNELEAVVESGLRAGDVVAR